MGNEVMLPTKLFAYGFRVLGTAGVAEIGASKNNPSVSVKEGCI